MIRMIVAAVLQYAFARFLLVEHDVRQQAGKVMRSVLFFTAGGLIGGLVAGFLLLALFFQLADMATLVQPALITAGIGFLLSLVLFLEGWRVIRRKEKQS